MRTVRRTAVKPTGETKAEAAGRIESVRKLIASAAQKIQQNNCTVGDFIRLLQLEKQLEAEEPPREIRVTWIDRTETPGSGK